MPGVIRLGLLRGLRCHVGFSGAFPIAHRALRCRQSPFRTTMISHLRCRIYFSSFYAYCICAAEVPCIYATVTHMCLLRNDGYSHLPSLLTVLPLGLVFMQSSIYPHTQFSLRLSRGLVTGQLSALLPCFVPCSWFPAQVRQLLSGFGTRLLPCDWQIHCSPLRAHPEAMVKADDDRAVRLVEICNHIVLCPFCPRSSGAGIKLRKEKPHRILPRCACPAGCC